MSLKYLEKQVADFCKVETKANDRLLKSLIGIFALTFVCLNGYIQFCNALELQRRGVWMEKVENRLEALEKDHALRPSK